ncbi:MAG TPA: YkgJ family cysteine cluster protein [Candidatus Bathyarchaeota archaeon]|nr:YkgJ family cysteine cluster protein [Candidatus Bathyarchaeota archaeon]
MNGKIDFKGRTFKWRTSFPDSFKFECLKCAYCCGIHYPTLREDEALKIRRITGLKLQDFIEPAFMPVSINDPYQYQIKKDESGVCVFLDKKTRLCRIHRDKPLICRTWPFQIMFRYPEIVVDVFYSCYAIASGKARRFRTEFSIEDLIKEMVECNADLFLQAMRLQKTFQEKYLVSLDDETAKLVCWDFIVERGIEDFNPFNFKALISSYQKKVSKSKYYSVLNLANVEDLISELEEERLPKKVDKESLQRWIKTLHLGYLKVQRNPLRRWGGIDFTSEETYKLLADKEGFYFKYRTRERRIPLSELKEKPLSREAEEFIKEYLKYTGRRRLESEYAEYISVLFLEKRILPSLTSIQLQFLDRIVDLLYLCSLILASRNGHEIIELQDVGEAVLITEPSYVNTLRDTIERLIKTPEMIKPSFTDKFLT